MIGVCIKYFHENYGGMLQAYATISMLEKLGIDYELIQYEKKYTPIGAIKSIPRLFNGVLLNDKYEALLKKIGKKKHPEFSANDAIRLAAFREFKDKHFLKKSPVFVGYPALCEGANRYEAVITGSDQLWSPAGLPTNFYNLNFVPNNIKKVSYASSFGVKNIPWYQKNRTRNFLDRIDYISMREQRGSEIVEELTGKNVPTILDPVFMFDKDGWENLIPQTVEYEEPYLFAYFLGENADYRLKVNEAAKKLGCKVVALRHLDQFVLTDEEFGDYSPYDVAPDRFLNLIRGAKYICTDSFHGACFSIIHHKQFVVFNRYSDASKHSKNSRIDTLCSSLRLNDRRYSNSLLLDEQLESSIDWQVVTNEFCKLKAVTDDYINRALGEFIKVEE